MGRTEDYKPETNIFGLDVAGFETDSTDNADRQTYSTDSTDNADRQTYKTVQTDL